MKDSNPVKNIAKVFGPFTGTFSDNKNKLKNVGIIKKDYTILGNGINNGGVIVVVQSEVKFIPTLVEIFQDHQASFIKVLVNK
jgi:hypothetical protein